MIWPEWRKYLNNHDDLLKLKPSIWLWHGCWYSVTETADVLGLSKQWFTGNGLKHKLSSAQQVSGGIAGDTGGWGQRRIAASSCENVFFLQDRQNPHESICEALHSFYFERTTEIPRKFYLVLRLAGDWRRSFVKL